MPDRIDAIKITLGSQSSSESVSENSAAEATETKPVSGEATAQRSTKESTDVNADVSADKATVSADKATKSAERKPGEGRMRPFAGNSYDDYRDHAMRDYPRPGKLFIGFVVGFLALVTKLLWYWRIEDGHKLWDDKRGRVIVMNHVSMLEPVAIYVSLYMHGIRCRFVYKSEFDRNVFLSWLLSRAGCIPVERGTADLKAVRRCERALKRGECVLVYPEGTRIRRPDQQVVIHGGFALMAQLGHAPVQPAAVVGALDITPEGTHLKRFFWRVWLKAGEPIDFDDPRIAAKKRRKAKVAEMERIAMEQVYALRDQLRQEHPGKR